MTRLRTKSGKGTALAFFLFFPAIWGLGFFRAPCCAAQDASEGAAETEGGGFPLIKRLGAGDPIFRQYIADVEINRRRLFNRERSGASALAFAGNLTIYCYTPLEGEDLFSLAARCNIPYSTIASLNRLNHPVMLETGRPLLLPSMPGLFIPQKAAADFEKLLGAARLASREAEAAELRLNAEVYYFFPGADFSPTERIFFLNAGFRFPLRSYQLTSAFGLRQNPVTGNTRFHQGLDLAAPAGTEVFAAAEGIVTEIGEDPVYGIYIIIKHGESWASLYGHLQKVETILRSTVRSGTLIGRVGSTGQSTGPHLHFELRQNGKARDPGKFLFQN